MRQPSLKNGEYREQKEFNPFLWTVRKKLFALRRYALNKLIILLGILPIAGSMILKGQADSYLWLIGFVLIGLGFSIRIAFEWERVPVLRFGKMNRTKGPGLFFLIPVVDIPYGYVDCRTTVTDFSAEKVLTKDAVPVYVDAIIFWMIWDAAKSKLEVENYRNAVPLSAKTALREIIGRNTLTDLLADRKSIGDELQKILDSKTNPWGITSLSVEIKDIVIPKELEDSISKEAQAEREKSARIILGEAEKEISLLYSEASESYKDNEEALQLRSLNLLMEAVRKNGNMILVPSETPNLMNKAVSAALAKNSTINSSGL